MAKRKSPRRGLSKKKPTKALDLTRVKLLYGLSGIFTLAVAALLVGRPAPLSGQLAKPTLAAQTGDPLDAALFPTRGIDTAAWNQLVVEKADSLGSATFHFAVLPQAAGDQVAISAEWSRQVAFADSPGQIRVVLISSDVAAVTQQEKSIVRLVDRLASQLSLSPQQVVWR